tara:strand:- start:48 stop:917 length:870 start_codon:yes stop_codon:yes gene_type:complete
MHGYDPRGTDNICMYVDVDKNGDISKDLFSFEKYMSENLFKHQWNLHFVFQDATTFILPPQKDFRLSMYVSLSMNKLKIESFQLEGLEERYYQHFDLETVRLFMWEMALGSFGYQVDLSPVQWSDESYKLYLEEVELRNKNKKQRDFVMKPFTETEFKSLILAVDYLNLVQFFKNEKPIPMYLANREIIRDWNVLQDFMNMEKGSKQREPFEKKREAMMKSLQRIPSYILEREKTQKKVNYHGSLDDIAKAHLKLYLQGGLRNTTNLKGNTLKKERESLFSWITTEVKV